MAQAAAAVTIISAIVGAGTAVYSAKQQHDAAGDAEDLAKQNAKAAEAQTAEEARRLETTQQRDQSLARARAAASGVNPGSGTTSLFLEEMESTQESELEWLKRSGYYTSKALKDEGKMASAAAKTAAFGSAARAVSFAPTIYKTGEQAKWWG